MRGTALIPGTMRISGWARSSAAFRGGDPHPPGTAGSGEQVVYLRFAFTVPAGDLGTAIVGRALQGLAAPGDLPLVADQPPIASCSSWSVRAVRSDSSTSPSISSAILRYSSLCGVPRVTWRAEERCRDGTSVRISGRRSSSGECGVVRCGHLGPQDVDPALQQPPQIAQIGLLLLRIAPDHPQLGQAQAGHVGCRGRAEAVALLRRAGVLRLACLEHGAILGAGGLDASRCGGGRRQGGRVVVRAVGAGPGLRPEPAVLMSRSVPSSGAASRACCP